MGFSKAGHSATDKDETQPMDVMQLSPPPVPVQRPLSPDVPTDQKRDAYQLKGRELTPLEHEQPQTTEVSDKFTNAKKEQKVPEAVKPEKVTKDDENEDEQFTDSGEEAF